MRQFAQLSVRRVRWAHTVARSEAEAAVRATAVLGAGLLCVLTLVAAPVYAAPTHLEVAGSRSASAEVSFATSTRLDVVAATATLGGSYAVLHVERHAPAAQAIDLVITFLPSINGDRKPVALGATESELPAGRYRVSMFTDGAASIKVPATGAAAGVRLRPAGRLAAKVTASDVPVDQPTPVTWTAASQVPVRAGGRPLVVYGGRFEYGEEPLLAYDYEVCVVPRGDTCSGGDLLYGTGTTAQLVEPGSERVVGYANHELLSAGADYDVMTEYSGLVEPRTLRSFVLAVNLPAWSGRAPRASATPSRSSGARPGDSGPRPLPSTGAALPVAASLAALGGAAIALRARRAGGTSGNDRARYRRP